MSAKHIETDVRRAATLRTYRERTQLEMQEMVRKRNHYYRMADLCEEKFDVLAGYDRKVAAVLHKIALRLQRNGAYFVSEEQVAALKTTMAEVKANEGKFCHWWGVDSIHEIAAHEFDDAIAALETKRTKAAA